MADQRIIYSEEMVGASHPTKSDTLNRLVLIDHNNDGTHEKLTLGSDADGDMYYRASNVLARLAKGAANLKLFMNSGATAPEWGVGLFSGQFTYDMSSTGDASITGVGFKPSLILFWAIIDSGWPPSIGFATSSATQCFYSNGASSFTYGGYAWGIPNVSGGHLAYPSAIVLDADGFTYTKAQVGTPTGTGRVNYIAFR